MTTLINKKGIKTKIEVSEDLDVEGNKKLSLLDYLIKTKPSAMRFIGLQDLINKKTPENYELRPNQLKASLLLFPKESYCNAFKLLVNHFGIKLSAFSESEIEELKVCLSQDRAFDGLLPFAKKNFAGIFPAKQNSKRVIPHIVSKRTLDSSFNVCKHNMDSRQVNNLPAKFVNRNRTSLVQLRLSFIKECSEERLNFFNRSETKTCYQALIPSMGIEEFKNFIEIFPPHDAIKFMNYSLIKNQIDSFPGQLTSESYSDLLTHFKGSYQREAVKKLLRPIVSPEINTKLTRQGVFKAIDEKAECAGKLPDIVASHSI